MLFVLLVTDPIHRDGSTLVDAESNIIFLWLFAKLWRQFSIAFASLLKSSAGIVGALLKFLRVVVERLLVIRLFGVLAQSRIWNRSFERRVFDAILSLASSENSECWEEHEEMHRHRKRGSDGEGEVVSKPLHRRERVGLVCGRTVGVREAQRTGEFAEEFGASSGGTVGPTAGGDVGSVAASRMSGPRC